MMRKHLLVIVVLGLASLSGCSMGPTSTHNATESNSTRSASAPQTASATPDASPSPLASESDLAFTITATFASGTSHATVSEAVYAPTAAVDTAATTLIDTLAECAEWRTNAPATSFIRVLTTTTVATGTSWPAGSSIGVAAGDPPINGSDAAQTLGAAGWTGGQRVRQSSCTADRWLTVPGTSAAFVGIGTLVSGASPADSWTDWAYSVSGQIGDQDGGNALAYTGCSVTLGPFGRTDPTLSTLEPLAPIGAGVCGISAGS